MNTTGGTTSKTSIVSTLKPFMGTLGAKEADRASETVGRHLVTMYIGVERLASQRGNFFALKTSTLRFLPRAR